MNLNSLPVDTPALSWFYLRKKRITAKGTEMHRVGCIAILKLPKGFRAAFSLAVKGDQFVTKLAREKAIQKLHSDVHAEESASLAKELSQFSLINLPALSGALLRNDLSNLVFSIENQKAYEGAVKELTPVEV